MEEDPESFDIFLEVLGFADCILLGWRWRYITVSLFCWHTRACRSRVFPSCVQYPSLSTGTTPNSFCLQEWHKALGLDFLPESLGPWRGSVSSVTQFSRSVMSDSLRPHELQHARPPCPSPTPRVYPDPCPSSWWCHPAISSSVVPFSSCPQSFPASEPFPMSQLFASGGQSIGVSASTSILPMNTQDWSLGWTVWMEGLWCCNTNNHLQIENWMFLFLKSPSASLPLGIFSEHVLFCVVFKALTSYYLVQLSSSPVLKAHLCFLVSFQTVPQSLIVPTQGGP